MEITVKPAENVVQCLEKFGAISRAMSIGHAQALSRALGAYDNTGQSQALADAREILEAQMQLAQIELFLHNIHADSQAKTDGATVEK